MAEGYYETRRRISPTGVTVVILLHGAAITALALSKMEMAAVKVFTPIRIENVPILPDPAPVPPPPEVKDPVRTRSELTIIDPIVPRPNDATDLAARPSDDPVIFDPGPQGEAEAQPQPLVPIPQPDPVRIEAQLRSGEAQPPYPPSEQRLQREGKVVVRVTIGADGRVKAVQKVSATSDAFYRATEKHALSAWRFRAATLDGRPVESSKTVTVRFTLDG